MLRLRREQVDAGSEMQSRKTDARFFYPECFAARAEKLAWSKGSLSLEEVISTVCKIELAACRGSTPSKHHPSSRSESLGPQSQSRD